ncbi:MAG: VOC family protein [Gemmatimonadota bacterium]|nr:VOC family protein [Gemmatimonadota bacterium]
MSNGAGLALKRITQIAIPVRDVTEAARFYRETLGLKHLFDAPPALSFFDCAGVRLMLAGPDAQGEDGDKQHAVIFYDVSDIREAHATLKSSGAKSLEEPRIITRMNGHEIWLASVSDGQGNVVSLMSEVAER